MRRAGQTQRGRPSVDDLIVDEGRAEDAAAIAPLILEAHRPFYEFCFGAAEDELARYLDLSTRDPLSELFAGRTLVARHQGRLAGMVLINTSEERRVFGRRHAFLLREAAGPAATEIFGRMANASRAFSEPGADALYIARLAVVPEMRSHGVGSALVRAAARKAAANGHGALELHVAATNTRGRAFYAREGFIEGATETATDGLPAYVALRRPVNLEKDV